MSRRRTTFGKLQRDCDKQASTGQAGAAGRAGRAGRRLRRRAGQTTEADQATVLAQLADLHAAFDDGKITFDDFEARREELTSKLRRRLTGDLHGGSGPGDYSGQRMTIWAARSATSGRTWSAMTA